MRWYLVCTVICCACDAHLAAIQSETTGGDASTDAPADAAVDAQAFDAELIDAPLGPFPSPTRITQAGATTDGIDDPTMTSDGLDIIFAISAGNTGNKKLYEMTRTSLTAAWSAPVVRSELDIGTAEESPRFGLDDLTLYYGVDGDIYTATRAAVGGAFGTPTAVAAMNTANHEKWMAICQGNNVMVSRANGTNGQDLYEGTLAGGANTLDTVLSSTSNEISTFLSKDCLTVYFASDRSGQTQIYTSTRATISSAWSAPVMAASPFSSAEGTDNEDAWISNDQRIFLLASVRGGISTKQLYISQR